MFYHMPHNNRNENRNYNFNYEIYDEDFSKGFLMVLVRSGNHTHFEIPTGNS